jgi:hypothetical protein
VDGGAFAPAAHAGLACAALPLAAAAEVDEAVAAAGDDVCAGGSSDDDEPHAATAHAVAMDRAARRRTRRVYARARQAAVTAVDRPEVLQFVRVPTILSAELRQV